jgi:hypothetical protein
MIDEALPEATAFGDPALRWRVEWRARHRHVALVFADPAT